MNNIWLAAHFLDLSPASVFEFLDKKGVKYVAEFTRIKPKKFYIKEFHFLPSYNCEAKLEIFLEGTSITILQDFVLIYKYTDFKDLVNILLYNPELKKFYSNENLYYCSVLGELL